MKTVDKAVDKDETKSGMKYFIYFILFYFYWFISIHTSLLVSHIVLYYVLMDADNCLAAASIYTNCPRLVLISLQHCLQHIT